MSNPYSEHNAKGKASFDHVYDLPDPRGYFVALDALDYRTPEYGSRVFSALLQAMGRVDEAPPKVLDLCCSYGVNAALLKYDLTLDDLYARYTSEDLRDLSSEELAAADAQFFAGLLKTTPPEIVGTDAATNAVSYALRTGLLDAGTGENLEQDEPTQDLRWHARSSRLVTVTGGVGYIWQRTFNRVLRCVAGNGSHPENVPWVAAFAVRFLDYAPIAAVLSEHGLTTEKISTRTFAQRRFKDADEREHVMRQLSAAGVDPAGKEETGWYHVDLYLSRPTAHAAEVSADELLGASGTLDH